MSVVSAIIFHAHTQTVYAQENPAVFRNFYIYKIALYLKYPESRQSEFIISVVGEDNALIAELQKTAASRRIGEKSIKIQVTEDLSDLGKSNIVVVPQKYSKKLTQLVMSLHGKPVVVISENAECQDTCINLTLQGSANGKKRFEINRANTEAGGVRVSSDLLAIAAICQ